QVGPERTDRAELRRDRAQPVPEEDLGRGGELEGEAAQPPQERGGRRRRRGLATVRRRARGVPRRRPPRLEVEQLDDVTPLAELSEDPLEDEPRPGGVELSGDVEDPHSRVGSALLSRGSALRIARLGPACHRIPPRPGTPACPESRSPPASRPS